MWRRAEGGESGREENCSLKEWSLFLQVVYLFVQAAIDVLFKVGSLRLAGLVSTI